MARSINQVPGADRIPELPTGGRLEPETPPESLDDRGPDIEEAARIRLQHSPYRALRRVTCDFLDGTLTLRGSVPTFHYKQLAQVSILGLLGVKRIINEIDVDGR